MHGQQKSQKKEKQTRKQKEIRYNATRSYRQHQFEGNEQRDSLAMSQSIILCCIWQHFFLGSSNIALENLQFEHFWLKAMVPSEVGCGCCRWHWTQISIGPSVHSALHSIHWYRETKFESSIVGQGQYCTMNSFIIIMLFVKTFDMLLIKSSALKRTYLTFNKQIEKIIYFKYCRYIIIVFQSIP